MNCIDQWFRRALLILAALSCSPAAWGQAASTIGQTGLLNMPDARIAPDGTLRFGYSYAEPYPALWGSVTFLPRLEASGRFTRIMRVPGFPDDPTADYGDFKDKSIDGKFVLFEEGEYFPQFAIGGSDFIGTKVFPTWFAVASKRIGDFDFTLGYGGKRIDGLFGGLRYRPSVLPNWALVAEYDANDYASDPSAVQSGAAAIKKGPGVGVEYTWGWVTGQVAYTREKPAAMLYASIPLSQKDFVPKYNEPLPYTRITPRPTLQQWLESGEHRQRMAEALAEQDFRNIRIAYIHSRVEVTLTNSRISRVSRAVGRAARTILLTSPIGTREIRITYTVRELPVVTYSFFDLDRLQRYFNGMLPRWELAPYVGIIYATPGADDEAADMSQMLSAFEEHQPGLKVLYQDEGHIVSLKSEDLLLNQFRIRPSASVYLNDPSGAFKYEIGVQASLDHRLANRTFFSAAVNYNIFETVSDVTQPSNSLLPHVRSDIAEYKRASPLKLTRLLVNQLYFPAERVYARASAGYYEEMYAGAGGQVLFLPSGARWGVDFAVDWLQQRDFEGLGFRDYHTVTAIGSFNYRLPLGMTATARVGRFLAKDEGVRFELKRRFASGWEVGAWYTYTNGDDITSPGSPGNPYHDKGVFMVVPLGTLLTKDTQGTGYMSLAPWTRDVGQMVVSPLDLYRLMEKPLVLDVHEHDGLVQFGDRDDDYHRVPERTLFDRPFLKDLDRDLRYSGQAFGSDRTWRAIGLGAGLTLLSAAADKTVDEWAVKHGSTTSSAVENAADFGNALPIAAYAGAGLLALAGDKRAADTGYTALESGALAAAVAVGTKYAVGRLRPDVAQNNHDFAPFEGSLSDKSFPSDRTTVMWATITPFAKEYEMPWLYSLALFTNFGRVADRQHWFSDTVAGSLLGYGIGTLLWESHRRPERQTAEVVLTGNGVAVRSRW